MQRLATARQSFAGELGAYTLSAPELVDVAPEAATTPTASGEGQAQPTAPIVVSDATNSGDEDKVLHAIHAFCLLRTF